ncbi:MAG: 50S ribosomal protein L25 [Gemmatimonadota bacterium]
MALNTAVTATPRIAAGKGAARSLRRAGKLPAVVYGHHRAPEALELDALSFERLLTSIGASTAMIELTVDGRDPVKALIREVQRDPVRPSNLLHVDLYEVRGDEKITVEVPVHLTGIASGVRNFAGVLDHILHRIEIEVFPADMPDHIDVDVTLMEIGEVIFVRDIQIPNAKILNDPDQAVCTVVPPRVEEAPVVEAEVAPVEPELIRKPKPEDEADEE